MSNTAMKITGLKEIQRALNKLPLELQKTTETAALRSGAKPILTAAKSNAKSSEDTGLLLESLGVNVRKGRSGATKGIYTARIGARKGFRKVIGVRANGKNAGKPIYKDPVKYAHLVELGTSHSAAQPFIRPAVDSASSQVLSEMAKGYDKGLARAVAKLRKK
jgi:HK97 gp10 family phage protein